MTVEDRFSHGGHRTFCIAGSSVMAGDVVSNTATPSYTIPARAKEK
jgi:hypothetical protein